MNYENLTKKELICLMEAKDKALKRSWEAKTKSFWQRAKEASQPLREHISESVSELSKTRVKVYKAES